MDERYVPPKDGPVFSLTDEDGLYPTDEFLDAIERWHPAFIKELFLTIEEVWQYGDCGYWSQKHVEAGFETPIKGLNDAVGELFYVSTAGWSGNESIIRALRKNSIFWLCFFQLEERGGHFMFFVKDSYWNREENGDGG